MSDPVQLYYLDEIPSADGVTENNDPVSSVATGGQSASVVQNNDVSRFASRIESLEKYVSDLRDNTIRKDSDANLNSLTIKDKITAWWGKIGGWLIENGVLSTPKIQIDSNNERIRSTNYQTGVSGFTIQSDLVEAENLVARGTMKGATFAYDQISAVGGQLMVANADTLAEDMTAMDDCLLKVKGDTDFSVNDFLVIRGVASSGVQEEWMRIRAVSGNTYTVTRDVVGSFSANSNPSWRAGTPVVKQGSVNILTGNEYDESTLVGGTSPSLPSVFETLAEGDNDGKIKIQIDETTYDDVAVNLLVEDAGEYVSAIDGGSLSSYVYLQSGYWVGQSFKIPTGMENINKVYLANDDVTGTDVVLRMEIREGGTPGSGAIIGYEDQALATYDGYQAINFIFDPAIPVTAGNEYNIKVHVVSGTSPYVGIGKYSGNSYNDGVGGYYEGGSVSYGDDLRFTVFRPGTNGADTTAEVAERLQTAIRAVTGSTETVTYDTNHYVITSAEPSYSIKKLMTPSTGTDLSGNGATKYFDLGSGATENEGGYGAGGWLRLFGEGTNSPYYSVFKRTGVLYNDFVEACRLGNLNGFLGYSTNEFGIAIGDTDGYLKYDPTNGLRIGGASGNFPIITSGTAAPATTPGKVGDIYVDTTNHKVYISDGTTNSSNWLILN